MKKLIATFVSFAMLFSMATPVSAINDNQQLENTPVCVYSKTYEEITDTTELLKKAVNNYGKTSNNIAIIATEESDTQLRVSQLLSETKYQDGSVEKTYAYTGFVFLDETGKPMSAKDAMEEFKNHHDESVYEDQVYGYQTIHTTEKYDVDEYPFGDIFVRVDSIASRASFSTSGVKCTEIFQQYDVIKNYNSTVHKTKTTSSPLTDRTYTLTTGDKNMYNIVSGMIPPANGVVASSVFTTSNGTEFDITISLDTLY